MIGYLTHNYSLIHAFQPSPVRRTRGETLALNRVFKLAPKLSDYFREDEIVAVKGELERPISGLAIDSRRVVPGNVFFALPVGGPMAFPALMKPSAAAPWRLSRKNTPVSAGESDVHPRW